MCTQMCTNNCVPIKHHQIAVNVKLYITYITCATIHIYTTILMNKVCDSIISNLGSMKTNDVIQ